MADVVKQTLYWNSGEVYASDGNFNVALTPRMTAAQSHDGSDATYTKLYATDDADLFGEMAANFNQRFALDSCSVSGVISKVVVTIRGKRTGSAAGVAARVQVDLDGVAYGTAQSHGSTFANKTFEFATDPTDAAAWTAAKINAKKWGVFGTLACTCMKFDRTGEHYLSEFKVEVYGPENQATTGTTGETTISAEGAAGVPGPIGSDPETVALAISAVDGVGSPGAITTGDSELDATIGAEDAVAVPGPVSAEGETAEVVLSAAEFEIAGGTMAHEIAARDPEAVTSKNFHVVRVDDAVLGDADASTGQSDSVARVYVPNCTIREDNPVILCPDTANVFAGGLVLGDGFPAGTYVVSIDPDVSFTLSAGSSGPYEYPFVISLPLWDPDDLVLRVVGGALAALGGDAASWGEIAFVRFKAIAFGTDTDGLRPSPPANFRFDYKVEDVDGSAAVDRSTWVPSLAGLLRRDDDGLDPGDALDPYYVVTSAQSTTKPGGGAWTIEALEALTDLSLAYDTDSAHLWADLHVQELWVEVYGRIGVEPSKITVRQRIGQPIRKRVVSATGG